MNRYFDYRTVLVFIVTVLVAVPLLYATYNYFDGLQGMICFMVIGWFAGAIIIGYNQYVIGVQEGVMRGRLKNRTR